MVTAVVTLGEGYEPGTPSTAVVTIVDNDPKTPASIPDRADSVWSATMGVADIGGRLGYWDGRGGDLRRDMSICGDMLPRCDTFTWGGVEYRVTAVLYNPFFSQVDIDFDNLPAAPDRLTLHIDSLRLNLADADCSGRQFSWFFTEVPWRVGGDTVELRLTGNYVPSREIAATATVAVAATAAVATVAVATVEAATVATVATAAATAAAATAAVATAAVVTAAAVAAVAAVAAAVAAVVAVEEAAPRHRR